MTQRLQMNDQNQPIEKLLYDLKERAKELSCLYQIQELLNKPGISLDQICQGTVDAIPPGWQYPNVCRVKIDLSGRTYRSLDFIETSWVQKADIFLQEDVVGRISVYYTEERPIADEGPFLKEERKLIDTIAEQFGMYLLHQQLKGVFEQQQSSETEHQGEWWVIIDLLKRTDPNLLAQISRKMINYLCWAGVVEAERLLEHYTPAYRRNQEQLDLNQPVQFEGGEVTLSVSDSVFELASQHLSKDTILENIQQWIQEEQSGFLVSVLVNPSSSLRELCAAVERYHHLTPQGLELSRSREISCKIALIRRLLSDQPEYIRVAKNFISLDNFNEMIGHLIYYSDSHGKLGGKGAGLFLAKKVLENAQGTDDLLGNVKTPKTWYMASDTIFNFMSYAGLEDIFDQKYKEFDLIHQEYPYIVHVFKNSPLPPEIVKELSLVLDDLGDVPLIVRSSSLLEDRMGMAFAGKYKSLFIANRGDKEARLDALMDAIKEVYASMFGPDPLEYRVDHELIEHHEEMGIMIQEVVGTQIGHYFLPVYAGVAFSQNEFRWSSRIKRDDGLVRLVMGLGTRAVDRLRDDYPILVSLGQPNLRINVSPDEIVRYSPKRVDVINLEKGVLETIEIRTLLQQYGHQIPDIHAMLSIYEDGHIRQARKLGLDFDKDNLVVTFENLFARKPLIQQIQRIIGVLQENFNRPVDIEFAYNGSDFYLLQCRSQSYSEDSIPAVIPPDITGVETLFSANRYISNGTVSDISHIVYVDPDKYSQVSDYDDLLAVGRVVGKLNKMLPRRRFILMGPGRWGSRGDIKLGVSITYADIKNTAMLIEIARQKADYVPDPSFGTHFFLDLVEAAIRYLPLYPDDPGILFNESFFTTTTTNQLTTLFPEYAHLSEVIRVIDLNSVKSGKTLQVLMNAEQGLAVGILI
jgi:hypothetical protein